MLCLTRILALAGLLSLTAPPALADVVFTDSSMNLSSYTQTPVYTSANATLAISNGGGGVQAAVSISSPSNSPGGGAVGIVNNTFVYNPATQGAIQSLTVTKTVSFSTSVPVGAGQTPWTPGCSAMIEQDGKYYVAFTQGLSFAGGATETFTCSLTGLTAASFAQFNFSTGSTVAGSPNFAGDPLMFGVVFDSSAAVSAVLTYVDTSLSFDLVTASTPPALAAMPSTLSFAAATGSTATIQQSISVSNNGGSTADFTAVAEFKSPWVTVSPSSASAPASTAPGSPVVFTITVNPQGLNQGSYRDVIQFLGSNVAAAVPVSLLVTNPDPVLFAGPGGFTFTMVQGAGSSVSQSLVIANQGTSGSTVSWNIGAATASGIPNGNFLAFGEASGQTQAGAASNVAVSLNSNASSLAPGVYYELIQVSASGAQNSPQYSTAVLHVVPASTTIFPQVTPGGLLFTGAAGASIAPQQFTVNWSSTAFQVIVAIPSTVEGQGWLEVSPGSGVPTSTAPVLFNVSVNTAGLAAGVYTGTIQINGGAFGRVNVTLIVTPGAQTGAIRAQAAAASCTPSRVVLTETGIPASFTVPAGWPADLIAAMTDDCGNPVNNGSIAANFSDGDPPLALTAEGSGGQYIATWQPSKQTNATITLTGSAPKLAPATVQVAGFVTANQAPVLAPNGILNNLNPLVGGALAPGTVAAAFGSGLTTSQTPVSPNQSPLLNQFENTELIIGGSLAPLYFLSSGQLDVEIPAELSPLQQVSAVAIVNNALSLPITVPLVALAPGVAANADGTVIAQDTDFNLIDAANPAHPGEAIVIYLTGLGPTIPPVASGQPAPGLNPGEVPAKSAVEWVVQVNNQIAQVLFTGLTPGAIGLYQIDFVVPAGTTAGEASLMVYQGTTGANATTLPVAAP